MTMIPYQRLYINVDHVATIRQARKASEPDPVIAALECEQAGADGITAHLREDRRHIQDDDIRRLADRIQTVLNLEMACTAEMLAIAEELRPAQVTFVPERREEITTEGGLDLAHNTAELKRALERLSAAGVRTSLFIAPDEDTVRRSRDLGAVAIELHTGAYAHHQAEEHHLAALQASARLGTELGLAVHAGHGLALHNVTAVAAIPEIEELNIGHAIVSRAVLVGIGAAVHEMRVAMTTGRAAIWRDS